MTNDEPHSKKFLRNPVKRFGDLPLESQLHDSLVGIFADDNATGTPSFSYVSTNVDVPVVLLLRRDKDDDEREVNEVLDAWYSEGDLGTYTVFGPGMHPLCLVRQHSCALWTKKRTVYLPPAPESPASATVDKKGAKKAAVGASVFNVKKAVFGSNPTYSAFLGAHGGTDSALDHPLHKKPFLVMSTSNNRTEIARHFKFTACVTSIRTPSGDPAVDQVMAVERKSQLVVLASGKMRDLFVFLRPGGDKWSWSNEHAPGMLIAKGGPVNETVKPALGGPTTVKLQVAAGVDARVMLAVVLAVIAHGQTY